MMKKTTIAILSAALLLGGALSSLAIQAASKSEAGQNTVSSGIKLNPAITKEYGGAVSGGRQNARKAGWHVRPLL